MQKATSECVNGTVFLSIKINLKNKAVALNWCLLDVEGGLMVLGLFFFCKALVFSSYLLNLKSSKAWCNLGRKSREEGSLRKVRFFGKYCPDHQLFD